MPTIINTTKRAISMEEDMAYDQVKANYKETFEKIRSLKYINTK
jgi:hypothetical protein